MNVIQQQRDAIIHQFMLSLSSSCCHRVTIDNMRNIVKDIVNNYPEEQPQPQQRNIGDTDVIQVNHNHHHNDDDKFNHPIMIVSKYHQ